MNKGEYVAPHASCQAFILEVIRCSLSCSKEGMGILMHIKNIFTTPALRPHSAANQLTQHPCHPKLMRP